jgi:hypothetical protein
MHILFIIAAIVLFLACVAASIGIRMSTHRERFYDDVIDTGDGMPGPDVIDQTCSVAMGDTYYNLTMADGLQRHPNISNACFFSHPAVDGIMDKNLVGCKKQSAVDHPSIASIGVQPVQGADKCVVMLYPDMTPELYNEYEKQLTNLSVERSRLYANTMGSLESIKALIIVLTRQRDQAITMMDDQNRLEQETAAKIASITSRINTTRNKIAMRTSQSSGLQIIVNNAAADAARYEANFRTSDAAYNKDNADLQILNIELAATRLRIDGLNTEIIGLDNEINRLNGIITTNNNAFNNANSRIVGCGGSAVPMPAPLALPSPPPPPDPLSGVWGDVTVVKTGNGTWDGQYNSGNRPTIKITQQTNANEFQINFPDDGFQYFARASGSPEHYIKLAISLGSVWGIVRGVWNR